VVGCGLLAVLVVAVALAVTLRPVGWNLSALPRVDANTGMGAAARALDPGFRTIHPGAYDGQFYWGIAVDPLATGTLPRSFDKASYRYGHPLYGWLGWLASAGRARAVPAALVLIGVASMFVAAAAAVALGLARGRSGWEGLFVVFNPGLIAAVVNDLAEPLAVALLLVALLALVRGRWVPAWICLALLPLAKEPLIVVPLVVAVWELAHGRRRSAARLATTILPALLWWTYMRIDLGAFFTSGDTALGAPLSGWRSALLGQGRSGGIAVAVLVALLVLLVIAALQAARTRGPVELAYLTLAALAIYLAPNATVAFTTAMRNTAFLLVLVPFVIATPPLLPRRPWATPSPRPSS
jgi:uncharacterized membrane protein (UPF0136 family)